jgi:hypothetical protein
MKGKKMSVEDCIKVLENIKERGEAYPEAYLHFTKEYCEKLAEVEALAIDTVISILRNRE